MKYSIYFRRVFQQTLAFSCILSISLLACSNARSQQVAPPAEPNAIKAEALKRVTFDIKYMASDEMGGRQPGTPGIKLCEDYIIAEYQKAGLKPLENGTYLQELEVGSKRTVVAEETLLVLKGPNDATINLELGKDFQQLVGRNNFDLSSELVFVGYGINAEEHNYNDFGGVDVEGKIVVLIRVEPQANDPSSVFNGQQNSPHSAGRQKATAARRAGAAGILMVNNSTSAEGGDELVQPDRFRTNSLPFAHVKRSILDGILSGVPVMTPTGKKLESVKAIEAQIDSNLEPISQSIEGWSAEFKSSFVRSKTVTNNIIGIVEGEGPNADETIVIGAHYDHLGMGAYGSRADGRREIHNGADDNATGTAAVVELARRFGNRDKKPGRRLLFVCFTAEEMGLLGAIHYCENPVIPMEDTAMMMNFDMIGWLRDDNLTLYNWNSSADLNAIFDSANEGFGFDLTKPAAAFAGSDHLPFNQRSVPNVFIHTGLNDVYHTPEDDFEAINCEGALKVIDYSEQIIDKLASLEKRPTFGVPKRFRLGVSLDDDEGVLKIDGIVSGSVAEKVGLKKGDVVVEVDDAPITKRRELRKIIRRDAGKTIKMKLMRGGAEVVVDIELK